MLWYAVADDPNKPDDALPRYCVVEKGRFGNTLISKGLTYEQATQIASYLNDLAPVIEHGCKVAPLGGQHDRSTSSGSDLPPAA